VEPFGLESAGSGTTRHPLAPQPLPRAHWVRAEGVVVGELSAWHWAIVVLAAVLLFGSRRLPDAARSLGRSARILRAELRAGSEPPPSDGPESRD
jgi:TatA/E family protein of Tat protein translocase